MGWQTDDGQHEGWDAAEFPGGRFSIGSGGGGALVRHFAPGPMLGEHEGEPEVIDGRQAIGWRGMCECGWRGPLWKRVDTAEQQEITDHQIYASYADKYGNAPDWVADAIYAEWEAHLEPKHLTAVREHAQAARAAQARLDEAVHAALTAGTSWTDIGKAAGITSRAARERWSSS